MELHKNGFYMSEGIKWEDWHVGHYSEGSSYIFLKINDNNKTFLYDEIKIDFNFIAYLKSFKSIKELKEKSMVNVCDYAILEKNILQLNYLSLDKYPMCFELEIINPKTLCDKKGREYRFVEINEPGIEKLLE